MNPRRMIIALAKKYDCQWRQTRGGHYQLWRDGTQKVTVSRTPSDRRSMLNAEALLKRLIGPPVRK